MTTINFKMPMLTTQLYSPSFLLSFPISLFSNAHSPMPSFLRAFKNKINLLLPSSFIFQSSEMPFEIILLGRTSVVPPTSDLSTSWLLLKPFSVNLLILRVVMTP